MAYCALAFATHYETWMNREPVLGPEPAGRETDSSLRARADEKQASQISIVDDGALLPGLGVGAEDARVQV